VLTDHNLRRPQPVGAKNGNIIDINDNNVIITKLIGVFQVTRGKWTKRLRFHNNRISQKEYSKINLYDSWGKRFRIKLTSFQLSSTTGKPEILCCTNSSRAAHKETAEASNFRNYNAKNKHMHRTGKERYLHQLMSLVW